MPLFLVEWGCVPELTVHFSLVEWDYLPELVHLFLVEWDSLPELWCS